MATLTIEQESFTPLEQIPLPIPLQPLPSHHEGHPLSSSPTPLNDQPVFEAARLEPLRDGQRIAVTVLLITANIVQVRERFLIPWAGKWARFIEIACLYICIKICR